MPPPVATYRYLAARYAAVADPRAERSARVAAQLSCIECKRVECHDLSAADAGAEAYETPDRGCGCAGFPGVGVPRPVRPLGAAGTTAQMATWNTGIMMPSRRNYALSENIFVGLPSMLN